MNEELLKEWKQEEKLYDLIFVHMDQLLGRAVATDAHWGVDADLQPVGSPYDPEILFYSIHGAATVASIFVLYDLHKRGIIRQKDFWVHRCTSRAERFYLEKQRQEALIGDGQPDSQNAET